jgi:hypothetical protein
VAVDVGEAEVASLKAVGELGVIQAEQMQGVQPRNEREIIERNEERLLMLGPPLERIQRELLSMLIDRTFNQAIRADIFLPRLQRFRELRSVFDIFRPWLWLREQLRWRLLSELPSSQLNWQA